MRGHLWTVLLPLYFLAVLMLDPHETTNREYLQFVLAAGHPPPEHWSNGRYAPGKDDEPVVLVSWHDADAYCRFAGRRLPTVNEWKSACDAGKLKKRGNVWEWTSTDIETGDERFKLLCGPSNSCDCSHTYHPDWKNGVKGFRCTRDTRPLTWILFITGRELIA
jgi:Sulfatase-modifying factor enzyme 1